MMIDLRRAQERNLRNQGQIMKKMERVLKMLKSKSSISIPSGSLVSNPKGSSVYNSTETSVSNPSISSVFNPSVSSVSNPSKSSISNTLISSVSNPSVSLISNSSESSVSNPSEPSVSNTSVSSVSKPSVSSVSNSSRSSVSNSSISSVSNTSVYSVYNSSESSVSNPPESSLSNPSVSSVSKPSVSSVSNPSKSSVSNTSVSSVSNTSVSSVSNPSESSVSNPPESSVSNTLISSVPNQSVSSKSIPSRSSVSRPSVSSVSNPSGPSKSKKCKAKNTDRTRNNQSVEEDVSDNEEEVVSKLKDVNTRVAVIKTIQDNIRPSVSNTSRSSVSNPSGPSKSKKCKAKNTDRTRNNQSVEEDVSDNEEEVALKLKDVNTRVAVIKTIQDNIRPSVSNTSRSSVSNPSGPSKSKKCKAKNTDQTRNNQSVEEDVSDNEEEVASKLKDVNTRVAIINTIKDNIRPSVSNNSRSSVSNPYGPSTSKKYKAENTDRTRNNQSVEEDVSDNEEEVASKLKDVNTRVAVIKTIQDNIRPSVSNTSRSSVSNPSGPSKSKMCKAKNTDRTRNNQSVEEDVSDNEEEVASKLKDVNTRVAIINTIKDNIRPSVSNKSRSSVSNPYGPSTSKKYKAENTDQTRHNQSVEEDITEDEEAIGEHEEFNNSDDNVWVPIGSGKTQIHRDKYMTVNWKSYTIATRTLLLAVFSRSVLATHSLTGKKSPAFQDKPAKMCLDPMKVADVIWAITDRFNVERSLVRSIITTKCADECKMWKSRSKNNRNVGIS